MVDWERLSRVAFMFPDDSLEAQAFFEQLEKLLEKDANCVVNEDLILFTPANPPGALPVTSLELSSELAIPKLVLETDMPFEVRVGNFFIHSSEVVTDMPYQPRPLPDSIEEPQHTLLPMLDFVQRFDGHVARVGHLGLNVPAALLDPVRWRPLVHNLAVVATVYQYPNDELLYFLLPSTPAELQGNITEFVPGRDPMFELAYDQFDQLPVVQIEIETDLPRAEVQELLPEPYGISYQGLEEAFRAVYVQHPWKDLLIRFDVGFKENSERVLERRVAGARGQAGDGDPGIRICLDRNHRSQRVISITTIFYFKLYFRPCISPRVL